MARRCIYDDNLGCVGFALCGPQEEGEYEYASDHRATAGREEGHTEAAVLVQPLTNEGEGTTTMPGSPVPLCKPGQTTACARFAYRNGSHRSRPYNNGERASSRCAQYGGHWTGSQC
jgi:hypothetical protein